jgi:hypothetical protein
MESSCSDNDTAEPLRHTQRAYITKKELVIRSGLSASTVQRYKDGGRIPFFQPRGKGGRLLFPPRAVEAVLGQALQDQQPGIAATPSAGPVRAVVPPFTRPKKLPGPRPLWQT